MLFNFSPWDEPPYKDAAEKTALGGLSANAFLSEVSSPSPSPSPSACVSECTHADAMCVSEIGCLSFLLVQFFLCM